LTNFFQHKLNKKYLKYFLILGWVSIWASLSINPMNIFSFYENIELKLLNTYSLLELINVSRGSFQILYFIILLVSTLILFKTKKNFFKSDIIFILFLIIFLIEIISLFKTDNSNTNVFFTICSLNTILTVFLLKNFFSEVEVNLIFKLSIIFLIILLIFFGFQYLFVFFHYHINFYDAWGLVEQNFNLQVPRPTGLSRTALIIFIFLSNINLLRKPFDKINHLIMIYSIVLLLLLSSRTTIFLYILYILFYIYYFKIFKIQKLLTLLKKFVFIPLVIIFIIGVIQNTNLFNKNNDSSSILDNISSFSAKSTLRIYPSSGKVKNEEFSSGRINDWKKILKLNERKFFGNGVLGDRYLIDQSASNLFLYTYASSGIVGLFILVCILLIILTCIWKRIFEKSKFDTYQFVSSIILIGLMMRSILETSYGVFGIDFILFCICFFLIMPNNSYEPN